MRASRARGHDAGEEHDASDGALSSAPAKALDRPALLLLVDDDPGSIGLLSEALAGQPLSIAVAIDGEMALRQVRCEVPDLVLLDAVMPGLDGFEVCRRLKAEPATREVPILLMTLLADTASRERGLGLGAVDCVTKPFVREELVARVRTQLLMRAATSALSAAESALSEKNDELTRARASMDLAASLAHELNQPLTAVLSNAQAAQRLLSRTPSNLAEVRAALEDIVADDRRAGMLVHRMRTMLRRRHVSAAALDVCELVREVIPSRRGRQQRTGGRHRAA
ncbi:response regulator [Sorangium sp. So ce302]|uniref:response regulator n=1 Tax=Sorangium sp. So ce302 TaxID=3133297 RepID=UPI003F60A4C7